MTTQGNENLWEPWVAAWQSLIANEGRLPQAFNPPQNSPMDEFSRLSVLSLERANVDRANHPVLAR
jgi:hypothetical protein